MIAHPSQINLKMKFLQKQLTILTRKTNSLIQTFRSDKNAADRQRLENYAIHKLRLMNWDAWELESRWKWISSKF